MRKLKHCLICKSTSIKHIFNAKNYNIVQCQKCSFAQADVQPSFNELQKIYEKLHFNHQKYRSDSAATRENKSRLNLVSGFLPENAIILDAGCGNGEFIFHAKSRYIVYGSDLSANAIAHAKNRFPDIKHLLTAGSLNELNSQKIKFDGVCLWDVIEHLEEPEEVIAKLFELLKPGGYMFLSTPKFDSITSKIMRQHWAFMIPPLHLGFFSSKSLYYLFCKINAAEFVREYSRGKWTNLGFIFYKIHQMSSKICPKILLEVISKSRFSDVNIYVPSNDITYAVFMKSQDKRS